MPDLQNLHQILTQGSNTMANFTPFSKTSLNVTETINIAATDRNINNNEVDFDLLGVQTLVQSLKYKEWTIIEEPLEKIFDEAALRSDTLYVRQEYQIRIKPFKIDNFLKNIRIDMAYNKSKSKVVATFKEGSIFACDPNLAKLLKREINKRKLRLGFLIGHFEENLNATLIKLAKAIKCDTPLPKDVRITIASSPGAIYPIDDSIILHYEKNKDATKSLIEGVHPDVLVFEYIKPQVGLNGRACNGDYTVVPPPKIQYAHYIPDKETIQTKEDEESIKYYSKVDGYVKNFNGHISISKEIFLQSASFRNTGSINTGADKDIFVKIENKNSSDDAVGSGVTIDVKELNVAGTVGSNTKVKATDLKVGEQTHRNSQLEAVENAKIHLHRGNLKAKTAEIDILENGTVIADKVYVKMMLGGEIIGHNVVVEELTSNTTIIASESIEIHKISGDHNKLIIDPNKIEDYHLKIEAYKIEFKEKEKLLREFKAEHEKKLLTHQAKLPRVKIFQQRVLAAANAKTTPSKADVIRVREYKSEAVQLKTEAEAIGTKENEINNIHLELEKLYEAELHAKIVYKERYDGRTQVIFIDVKTAKEYAMSPEGFYENLFLIKEGDDKRISW